MINVLCRSERDDETELQLNMQMENDVCYEEQMENQGKYCEIISHIMLYE